MRVPRAEIDAFTTNTRPSLTVLVPSCCEDPGVVRSTLLSAALQEYPGMRIVLLLDDPPSPTDPAAAASLADCRALPSQIAELLRGPHGRFLTSFASLDAPAANGGSSSTDQIRALTLDFAWAGSWLRDQASTYPRTSHADAFLADEVLGGLVGDLEITARALFAALDQGAVVPAERLSQLCRRLVRTFGAEISSFERKAYSHLSQPPSTTPRTARSPSGTRWAPTRAGRRSSGTNRCSRPGPGPRVCPGHPGRERRELAVVAPRSGAARRHPGAGATPWVVVAAGA